MFKVPTPMYPPAMCAVSGKTQDPDGFVDFGIELPGVSHGIDPHVYISNGMAKDIGRFVGMIDAEEYERVQGELDAAEREADQLREQLTEAERFAEAVDYTLKGVEKIRQKPGPRKAA